jgi:hypothetical protein
MNEARRISNRQAQDTLRAKRAADGVSQLVVWLPRSQHPEWRALAKMMRDNPTLNVVSVALQDGKTGRMRGVKLR